MKRAILAVVMSTVAASAAGAIVIDGRQQQPVTTFSIVARDPSTGEMGVAVQSHWFSVGHVVPWAEAGVGAVATQSLVEVTYGPLGLEMMRAGKNAQQALDGLLQSDPTPQWRQVGMMDAKGNIGVHTGSKCIREAGHATGEDFIAMANLMEKNTVWDAMAEAFESASGDLTERMLRALEAAQREGGDIRGRQSAAIIVVRGESTGAPYRDRLIDLRVEDHPEPIKELRRLVQIDRAYHFMNLGDEKLAENNSAGALDAYRQAMELAPDIVEIEFWVAVTLFASGEEKEGLGHFKSVFEKEPRWMEVVRRLPPADLLNNENGEVERILSVLAQ